MIALIIPIHNQDSNIERIYKGILNQTQLPDNVYFVFDRCKCSDELSLLLSNNIIRVSIIELNDVPKSDRNGDFYAGYARNEGLKHAIIDGNEKFVFIDGDCVPQTNLIESHNNSLIQSMPVISVARRREKEYRWLDRRETISDLVNVGFFGKNGLVINNPDLIKNALVTWTCNLGINIFAVRLIQKFNLRYYNENVLFNSLFNGQWGGEDTFLGIEAWYCKVIITTIGHKSAGIEHIPHLRPDNAYSIKSKEFIDECINNLRKKLVIQPLDINFFNIMA